MNEELKKKISQLKEKWLDADSQGVLSDYEKNYEKIFEEKQFFKNPIFIEVVEKMEKQVNEINILLTNDENLTEGQRSRLYSDRLALKKFCSLLGIKIRDSSLTLLEESIDRDLLK